MKLNIGLLVAASSAFAQLPPTCAINCATELALKTGCTNVADIACQCKPENQAAIAPCIQQKCSPSDATKAIAAGMDLCKSLTKASTSSSSLRSSSSMSSSSPSSKSVSNPQTSSPFTSTTFTSSIASSAGYITVDHTVTVGLSSISSSAPSSGNGSSNNSVGAIAGGTVGGVVALALLAAFIFFLRRRNKKSKVAGLSSDSDLQDAHQVSQLDGKPIMAELDSSKQQGSINHPLKPASLIGELDTSKPVGHNSTAKRAAVEMP